MDIENRLSKIEKRLDKVEREVGDKQHGVPLFGRLLRWFVENKVASGLIVVLTLLLALLGIFASPLFSEWLQSRDDAENRRIDERIDNKLKPINEQLQKIDTDVAALKGTIGTLRPFIQDLVEHQFAAAAEMKPNSLLSRLSPIQHLVQVARSENIKADPATVLALGRKVAFLDKTQPNADRIWPASAALASYRSALVAGESVDYSKLPDCINTLPISNSNFGEIIEGIEEHRTFNFNVTPYVYRGCRLVLEDLSTLYIREPHMTVRHQRTGPAFASMVAPHVFESSLIIYRGGQLPQGGVSFTDPARMSETLR